MLLHRERAPADVDPTDHTQPFESFARTRHRKRPPRGPTDPRYYVVTAVSAALLAFVVVGVIVVGVWGPARHQAALSFLRQPEKYTELYFAGNGPTETSSANDRTVVTASFTIVNHERQATTFLYAVQAINDAQAPLGRAEGSVHMSDGESFTATVPVEIPATETWSALDIDLAGRHERIRFLRPESDTN